MKTKPIVLWFVCLASMILWSPSWAAPVEPIADANGPYIGGIGELITFDGSGSYAIENPNPPPVNEIILYEWDFEGDGVFDASTPNNTSQYAYVSAGMFNVTLRVTDTFGNVGEDMTTATIVPLPAAAWLFGSALLGLGVVKRKKA